MHGYQANLELEAAGTFGLGHSSRPAGLLLAETLAKRGLLRSSED